MDIRKSSPESGYGTCFLSAAQLRRQQKLEAIRENFGLTMERAEARLKGLERLAVNQ